jgi:hypothetical protein
MTPTKIVLERTATHLQLRVFIPEAARGSTVIESTPVGTGKSLPNLRRQAVRYAIRFAIPFVDLTA